MAKTGIFLAIAAVLLFSAVNAASTAYKWVDATGKTIYSQTPPPVGVPYQIVEQPDAQSSSLTSNSASSIQDQVAKAEEARLQKKEEQQRLAESDQIKQENCTQANTNLTALTSRGQVTIKEGDLYRKLTEEERQAKIAEAKSQISEFCN